MPKPRELELRYSVDLSGIPRDHPWRVPRRNWQAALLLLESAPALASCRPFILGMFPVIDLVGLSDELDSLDPHERAMLRIVIA